MLAKGAKIIVRLTDKTDETPFVGLVSLNTDATFLSGPIL